MKQKIGVYICHCGGNISDYVDVEKVREALQQEEGVVLAETTQFACADSNQKQMVEDIRQHKLDGVVVASCSPKLHEPTFRAVVERAGLNKYNYVHANIREQVSWPHSGNKPEATEKAIRLVRAAVGKVKLAEAIEPIDIETEQAVAVIGAGVAGMKSAIALAKAGTRVYLIEREHFIGGRIAQWDVLCTTDETGKDLVTRLYNEMNASSNITLFTGAEVVENSGSKGNYSIRVKVSPRYIRQSCDRNLLARAIEACPVEVPDEFNFNITNRKAIYHNFPSEYPHAAVIDMKHCTRCGECVKICDKMIDLDQQEEFLDLKVGSILVATGFDPYEPKEGEFGYRAYDNVITLPQFKRLVANSEGKLYWHGRRVQDIAYIYCVGSRQVNGDNKYCSRYCCTTTIYAAIKAGEKLEGLNHFHFTRGIRTYGKQEMFYHEASQLGHIFFQSDHDDPPRVEVRGKQTLVKVNDILSLRKAIETEVDLVVLVTGMVPRTDNSIGDILKLPRGRDHFFNEIHMKLRPVETVIDGVSIAGCCQGPKNVVEAINSSLSAAIKSYSMVSHDHLEVEPIVAEADPATCEWCGLCQESCPFDAIRAVEQDGKKIAVINEAVCKGCGMCLPVCPVNAIQLKTFSDPEVESMIGMLAMDL